MLTPLESQYDVRMSGNFLLIYTCNFHVLNNFLLIYICKLHWNLRYIGISNTYDLVTLQGLYDAATIKVSAIILEQPVATSPSNSTQNLSQLNPDPLLPAGCVCNCWLCGQPTFIQNRFYPETGHDREIRAVTQPAHTHIYKYTHSHMCICINMNIYISIHTHTYTYAHIHTYTYAHTYIHIYTHTYTYTHKYIHIYIHTHIY